VALNVTVRRGVMFLKSRGGLISFIVNPDVLKRVLKLVHRLFWNLSLTCRDGVQSVSIITCVWYYH